MMKLITLTTDFGLHDEYVGLMKGVILSYTRDITIVDLSHGIPKHDIQHAAYIMQASYPYFPNSTIHIIVVDPGVGSSRGLILLEAADQTFIAPDNGVLTFVIKNNTNIRAFQITNEKLYLDRVSATFHGRDIMAPVAAQIAAGLAPEKVGPTIPISKLVTIPTSDADLLYAEKKIRGSVVSSDHFGNITTNIHFNEFRKIFSEEDSEKIRIRIKNHSITSLSASYASVLPGSLLALFGSRGYLEIAINQGNAAGKLQIITDEAVEIDIG